MDENAKRLAKEATDRLYAEVKGRRADLYERAVLIALYAGMERDEHNLQRAANVERMIMQVIRDALP